MSLPTKRFAIPFTIGATAAADAFAIESSATKRARIRRVVITNPGTATAQTVFTAQLLRTTTAGSGGTVTPAPFDDTHAAYSGICRSGVGVGGTAGTVLAEIGLVATATASPITAFPPVILNFEEALCPTTKAGVANGISLRLTVGAGAANFKGFVEFDEESV